MKRTVEFCLAWVILFTGLCAWAAPRPLVRMDGEAAEIGPDYLLPDAALHIYQKRTDEQAQRLVRSEDSTLIHAELPSTAQKGDYELLRSYTAQPRTLHYASVKFEGDGFIKSTVIIKMLQSEVEQVEKGNRASTAINEQNYEFKYKGHETLNGRTVHVFALKPRRKAPGLFKGKIYIDAHTGSLCRMEGSVSKTPSFFLRRIDFVQDFADIDGFTVPTELHSTARAHIVGRAVVSIVHRGYRLTAANSSPEATSQASLNEPR